MVLSFEVRLKVQKILNTFFQLRASSTFVGVFVTVCHFFLERCATW